MTEQKVGFGFDSKPDLSVIYVDVKQLDFAMQLACKLRMDGVIVDIDYTCKSLKSQFKRADRQRTKYALVIGADEIAKGSAILRDMSTKKESEVELDNINSVIELLCKKK
jgi:histidyl-tRNA synthetase